MIYDVNDSKLNSFTQNRFLDCSVALHRNPDVILTYLSGTLALLNSFKDGTLKTTFFPGA